MPIRSEASSSGTAGVGDETLTDPGRSAVVSACWSLSQPAPTSRAAIPKPASAARPTPTCSPPFGTLTGIYTQGSTYKGWFLGAGDEYALSFLPGLFWKTEARASHYDRQTQYNYFNNTNIRTGNSYDAEKWVYSVRSELVYRFNFGGGAGGCQVLISPGLKT